MRLIYEFCIGFICFFGIPRPVAELLFWCMLFYQIMDTLCTPLDSSNYAQREKAYQEQRARELELKYTAEAEYKAYLDTTPYEKKYEIVSYYCDGMMDDMTPEYVEHYFDVISRGEEETLPRYNKERHVQKYGTYAKRYLYVPKEQPTKQNPSDSFKHMFWW